MLSAVYGRNQKEQATAIEMLLSHCDLVVQDAEVAPCCAGTVSGQTGAGFSECLMLQIAVKSGHVPLGTFDRGLAKVEGADRL